MHLQSLRIFIISLNANYRIAHLMPSRANDSFLQQTTTTTPQQQTTCQCPLGLMTHFYLREVCLTLSTDSLSSVNALSG